MKEHTPRRFRIRHFRIFARPWRLIDRQRRNYYGRFDTLEEAFAAVDRILAAEANRATHHGQHVQGCVSCYASVTS